MRKLALSLLAGSAALALAGIVVPDPANAGGRCGYRPPRHYHAPIVRPPPCAPRRVVRTAPEPRCYKPACGGRIEEAYPPERPAPLPRFGHATLGEGGRCWMNPQGPMAGIRGWVWSDGRCHLARP